MSDCADCKGLKRLALLERSLTCKVPEHFEPRDIYFCPHQIRWLIQNIQLLHMHIWVVGLYADIPKRSKPLGRGYFETPADYAIEVERRLEHCRIDGLLPYLHYAFEFPVKDLAKYYNISEKAVKYRMEIVIWYISGWNFRVGYRYRRDNATLYYENWKSQHP